VTNYANIIQKEGLHNVFRLVGTCLIVSSIQQLEAAEFQIINGEIRPVAGLGLLSYCIFPHSA
jgi:hypothetical protein